MRDDRTIDVPLYQLNGTHILWEQGDELSVSIDKVKNPSYLLLTPQVNRYFQHFYKTDFAGIKSIRSGEHSGQLKNHQRIQFEEEFRQGDLSLLCCSPTMELGIDISDLMAVHMRNVPPILLIMPSGVAVPAEVVRQPWYLRIARQALLMTSIIFRTALIWSQGLFKPPGLIIPMKNCCVDTYSVCSRQRRVSGI